MPRVLTRGPVNSPRPQRLPAMPFARALIPQLPDVYPVQLRPSVTGSRPEGLGVARRQYMPAGSPSSSKVDASLF